MFVKPAAGRTVRHQRTMAPLADAGEHVPEDTYWLRALACGDVERAQPPAAVAADSCPDADKGSAPPDTSAEHAE